MHACGFIQSPRLYYVSSTLGIVYHPSACSIADHSELWMTDPYFKFRFQEEDPDNRKPVLHIGHYFSVYFVRLVYIYLYDNFTDIITNWRPVFANVVAWSEYYIKVTDSAGSVIQAAIGQISAGSLLSIRSNFRLA